MTEELARHEGGTNTEEGSTPSVAEGPVGETAGTATTPPRRRRSRGGRGRGGRGRSTTARPATDTATAGSGTEHGGDGQPEVDLDRQPGETQRVSTATIVDADASADAPGEGTTSPARRRRSRGGRGRGGRGRTSGTATRSSGTDGAKTDASDSEPDAGMDAAESISTEEAPAAAASDGDGAQGASVADGGPATARRRRSRGGRGRSKKPPAADAETADSAPADASEEAATPRRAKSTATRSRSRTTKEAAGAATRPRTTRAKVKEDEEAAPTSTRLKRQRQSRQVRRRRDVMPMVARVTDKLMVITEHGDRDQIAVLEGRDLVQHYVTRQGSHSMVGNVYLGRVQNVLPGMEAAFVDVGRGRNAVLYAGEVNWSPEDLEGAPPRIEHVLKSGQSVLVQVTKDPIGGKGARLTAQISLPGRYLVLAPNSNVTGISRRLPDEERRRLKTIYRQLKPGPHGLIVRTAAEGASEEALAADLERLLAEWEGIEKRAKRAKAPASVYEEPELTLRVVRDLFTDEEFRELVTDSSRIFRLVVDYLRDIAPDLLPKVRLHEGKLPVFEEFNIVEQIHKGLDRKVWLPSGGHIVIDRTEAMTVIDVNTGKSVGKTNLEETVANTNIEAAREVARQLRLRDIGGMIVIDFIDMLLEKNKDKVIDAMKEALAQDKSRSQVFDISPLGLLEVTRKRVSGGLLDAFSETCPQCEGRGLILTYDVD
jgi:ribonuclease E